MSSDVPTTLVFVDPAEIDPTYRVCLWAASGQGKSVAAASAPGPIVVLTADRPSAYRFARKHWRDVEIEAAEAHADDDEIPLRPAGEIRETRYHDPTSLDTLYLYLKHDGGDTRTVVIDPISHIIDDLRDRAPMRADGDIDHQWVNKKVLNFVKSLRSFDVNVVLVAYEKLSDGKGGDGKLYPALGGGTLINKLLAEMDIVAHIERHVSGEGEEGALVKWIGQLQPVRNLVCKESTGALGDRRIADLSRWFEVANEALAPTEATAPWDEDFEVPEFDPDDVIDDGIPDELPPLESRTEVDA